MENKLYMKWWFWVVIGFVFITVFWTIMGVVITDKECEECKEELNAWYEYGDSVDAYFDALDEYCKIDQTNPVCGIMEE